MGCRSRWSPTASWTQTSKATGSRLRCQQEADRQCDGKVDLRDIAGKTGMTDDKGQFSYGGGTVVQWIRRCTAIVDLPQWKMRGS